MPVTYYKGKFSGTEIDEILTEMDELLSFYNENKMRFVYSDDVRNINVVEERVEEPEEDTLYVIKERQN